MFYRFSQYLESLIEQRPDTYAKELQYALYTAYDVVVDVATITRALHNRGFTRKKVCWYLLYDALFPSNLLCKVTRPARERNEQQRLEYQMDIGENYPPNTLVFLDESACNRFTANRTTAWAPIGRRARRHDYYVRGQR